jgi:TolB-like protein/class 3 adenylate cyclase/Tfp pilus assembly protein PilF
MTTRRKLSAILSADVAGYSRLMADDEAATLRALNEARAVFALQIAAYHGRLIDNAGDSVLADFDSAVEAVACAAEVQRDLAARNADLPETRRMLFRIGVNLGDVIEEASGLYGDGVNVAARLQALAEPGGVCISGTVFDQVEGKLPLAFKFMGEQSVKNIPKPVRAYRLQHGPARRVSAARHKAVWLAAVAALVIAASGAWMWQERAKEARLPTTDLSRPSERPRLAVLPLDNFSPSADDEYFSDGMTEELISKLSRVTGLDVIARTSVMRYKRTEKSIADIGRELGVSAVLEGSVRKAGDKVRITVQLVDVGTQAHLWSQDFDRDLKDVFATQSEISEQVAKALHVRLVEAGGKAPSVADLETYTLYLRGRHQAGDFQPEGLKRSILYFEQAIKRSPQDARSWAGMARSYAMLGWWATLPPDQSFAKAKPAAQRAIELDDRLAEAHISLGMVRFLYEWDWQGAEQAYLRALELAPGDSDAHLFYGIWLKAQGHNGKAVQRFYRANELDPFNMMANAELGWAAYFGGRLDEAVQSCRRTLEKDPNYLFALSCLQTALTVKKDPESVAIAHKLLDLTAQDPYFLGQLGWAYGMTGQRENALAVLAKLKALQASPPAVYYVYLGLQDKGQTLEWMERAYQGRWSDVIWIKTDPAYDWLRADPRFQALMKKMKLDV